MSKVTNTATLPPDVLLAGAMTFGSSEYIEMMEARGQRELVASDSLPTQWNGTNRDAALLALGFEFGEPDAKDPLFRPAKLPPGWRKEGSDHDMWSYVMDDKGRRRVAIFYKAASYDRWASMSLECRYAATSVDIADGTDRPRAMDGGVVLWEGPSQARDARPLPRDAARDWLDENRPGWRDPLALWDLP